MQILQFLAGRAEGDAASPSRPPAGRPAASSADRTVASGAAFADALTSVEPDAQGPLDLVAARPASPRGEAPAAPQRISPGAPFGEASDELSDEGGLLSPGDDRLAAADDVRLDDLGAAGPSAIAPQSTKKTSPGLRADDPASLASEPPARPTVFDEARRPIPRAPRFSEASNDFSGPAEGVRTTAILVADEATSATPSLPALAGGDPQPSTAVATKRPGVGDPSNGVAGRFDIISRSSATPAAGPSGDQPVISEEAPAAGDDAETTLTDGRRTEAGPKGAETRLWSAIEPPVFQKRPARPAQTASAPAPVETVAPTSNAVDLGAEPVASIDPGAEPHQQTRAAAPEFARAAAVRIAPDARAAIERAIGSIERSGDGVVEVTLDPPELGKLKISYEMVGDGLSARVTASDPASLELLRRHAESLLEDLRALGFDAIDLAFSHGGDDSRDAERGEPSPADVADAIVLEDAAAPRAALYLGDRLDIRL